MPEAQGEDARSGEETHRTHTSHTLVEPNGSVDNPYVFVTHMGIERNALDRVEHDTWANLETA